jgi:COX assembly protein 1
MVQVAEQGEVQAKEREALRSHMKKKAAKQCKEEQREYAECVQQSGLISMVWQCRQQAKSMSRCFSQFTSDSELSRLEQRWLEAGKPSLSQWANPND